MHPLIKRAQEEGNPLIDNDQATFLWEGETPPRLIGDFNWWGRDGSPDIPAEQIEPGLWAFRMTFPRDIYMEYNFVNPADLEERYGDPLSKRETDSGVGWMQHAFHMPEYIPTRLDRPKKGIAQGTVTKHTLEIPRALIGGKRNIWLYQPPVHDPVPLLLVLDGKDFEKRAKLPSIVDNLIAGMRIHPVAMLMIDNAGENRSVEYACSDMFAGLAADEMINFAREHLNLINVEDHPGSYGVMGASFGGLMALFIALRSPQVFGKVLAMSGAYTTMGYEWVAWDLARSGAASPLDIWMNVGRYDFPEILKVNPKMRDLLIEQGHRVAYREYGAGHNYPAWRDEAHRGLEHLYRF